MIRWLHPLLLALALALPALAQEEPGPADEAGEIAAEPALVSVPLEVHDDDAVGPLATERWLAVPAGFGVRVFAARLGAPRFMASDANGVLHVSVPGSGRVLALPDRDGDGLADGPVVVAEGLDRPHGLAFHDGWLYVAENGRVIRLADDDGDLRADRSELVTEDLPAGGGHWTRTLGFGPDGALYVSAGSSCNVCVEADPRRAAISRFEPNGSGGQRFATGLRNSVGFVWHPETGELWATDNGRDWLGDDLPPEELNRIVEGADYGWPRCYGDRAPDPDLGAGADCSATEPPAVQLPAHVAPLGLAFLHDASVPAAFQDDLLIALHGSWNRSQPDGYRVVRVAFADGQPTGAVADFAAGWLEAGGFWGRPVQPIVGPDGHVYLSDDHLGVIYRFEYRAE